MAKIYLALGSNVGDSDKYFDNAIKLLSKKISNIVESPRYKSKAVGFTDQPDFTNSVIRADTSLSPQELLNFTQGTEEKTGRIRRFRWGPREIDIDIIFYDDLTINQENLIIPHPRFAEREFVLKPILDLSPDFVDPASGQTIKNIYDNLEQQNKSVKN